MEKNVSDPRNRLVWTCDRRVQFVRWSAEVAPERLIFIDESGCNLAMSPTRGRSRGQRAADHRRPIGAETSHGGRGNSQRRGRASSPTRRDEYPRFIEFVERRLVPRLRPGDIVVLDNLLPHKAPRARIGRGGGCGAGLSPPYSPDFNPIEPFWGFVKPSFSGPRANSGRPALDTRRIIRRVPVRHLASWFRHCGFHHQPNRSGVMALAA
ncbi:MAG: transposase [Polyangiaceae bacterium]|nr:transposase [Polyangiaceae bacterium]